MASEASSKKSDGGAAEPLANGPSGWSKYRPVPKWLKAIPFFFSAFLYLSGFFSILSPAPLVFLAFQPSLRPFFLAIISNSILVTLLGGVDMTVSYFVTTVIISVVLPFSLKRTMSLERAAISAFTVVMLVSLTLLYVAALKHNAGMLGFYRFQVDHFLEMVLKSASTDTQKALLNGSDPMDWKLEIMDQIPVMYAISILVFVWANLVVLLRLNPGKLLERLKLDRAFFRKWRVNEYLVWPTIISGFLYLMNFGALTTVGTAVFKIFLTIYALHGLSILSYIFDLWNIRGLFRSLGYLMVITIMMPILLSLGFFDQWFDFRAKLRQS